MPTPTGAEPINERLFRLRTDLVRVRASIARGENNGASSNTGGVWLTEIAYEHLVERERKLAADISALEAASPDPPPAPASASYSPASPTERLAPGSTHPMPPNGPRLSPQRIVIPNFYGQCDGREPYA